MAMVSLIRIKALIQKEFRQILRTRAYLALIFIVPFVQLLIMGSAVTNEVKNIPMILVDQDNSPASREICRKIEAVSLFDVKDYAISSAEASRQIHLGRVKAAMVIPAHFERDMKALESPSIQILIDGIDGNSAGISLAYLSGVLEGIQRGWMEQLTDREVIPRFFYNAELESKLNFVPGLIGMLLLIITTMMTSINIVREKELGTLEQLMVSSMKSYQLIIGKVVPYLMLGLIQFTMGMIAARLVFGIPVKGNILLLYFMAFLFMLSTLGLGIFFSTVSNTQQQAMFAAWFTMIFTILLSGFFVPLKNVPEWVELLTYINPLRYFITVMREIYLKATPFRYLWKEAAAMAGIGIFLLLSSSFRFHKRLN